MKFLFLGKRFDEASTRYRIRPVAEQLEKLGHEVVFTSTDMSFFARIKFLAGVGQYDLVFIQRKLFPVWFLSVLRRRVQRLVFDFDDAIFVKSSGAPSVSRHKNFAAVCGVADLVLAGNAYLAAAAQEFTNHVEVVPTAVRTARYQSETAKHERPTLVWIGSRSTRRYLDLLTPVLDRLAELRPDIQLKVIADFELNLESMTTINVTWSEAEEVAELGACHIGIAPMANNAWTRGKCALKVIQYMAVGLPVISDRCGANQEVIVEGKTGFLTDNEQDWIDSITRLITDDALRIQMGEAGRVRARAQFDLDEESERLADRLSRL